MSSNPLIMGDGGGDFTAAGCPWRWSGHVCRLWAVPDRPGG